MRRPRSALDPCMRDEVEIQVCRMDDIVVNNGPCGAILLPVPVLGDLRE